MHKLIDIAYWLKDEAQTRLAGDLLAQSVLPLARSRPVVLFVRGDLGAGKSTFVRGFLAAAGVRGVMPSPTYSLVEPYESDDLTLYHMDAYRLADSAELDYLGLDDLHKPGCLTLIEWPDHIREALPDPLVTVDLSLSMAPTVDAPVGGQREPGDLMAPEGGATVGRAVRFGSAVLTEDLFDQLNAVTQWSEFSQVPT